MDMTNRHPVDELADVRDQRRALEAREKELREIISNQMGDKDSLGGDQFIARQKVSSRKGAVDGKRILKETGVDIDDFRKETTTVYSIEVEERVPEAA